MSEKNLDDFFRSEATSWHDKSKKTKKEPKTHNKNSKDNFFKRFYRNWFSFDVNVDLTDPTSVLRRRNHVIRHIIFIANIVFTIFSFVGITSTNYIVTIIFFLLMTGLSQTISFMLKKKEDDYSHQTIIMYLESLFAFLLAVILYIKVWLGYTMTLGPGESLTNAEFSVTQSAYLLIYFTIIIMSLYQSPKLLRVMYAWIFIIMTVIHLSFLHPELYSHATNLNAFLHYMFIENSIISLDIILRTLVLLTFFAALYSSVSISNYMVEQRKNEFTKRVDVEENFVDVVKSVFEAVKVYNLNANEIDQKVSAKRVASAAKELGIAMNYDEETIRDLFEFAQVHADKMKLLSIDEKEITNENFDEIMKKTKLATTIIRRLQLVKKGEDIVMAVFENQVTSDFRHNMTSSQNDRISQIILISEIYDILRCDRSYHKALNHMRAVELIDSSFAVFFDNDIVSRFNKYNHEIEAAYEKAL